MGKAPRPAGVRLGRDASRARLVRLGRSGSGRGTRAGWAPRVASPGPSRRASWAGARPAGRLARRPRAGRAVRLAARPRRPALDAPRRAGLWPAAVLDALGHAPRVRRRTGPGTGARAGRTARVRARRPEVPTARAAHRAAQARL